MLKNYLRSKTKHSVRYVRPHITTQHIIRTVSRMETKRFNMIVCIPLAVFTTVLEIILSRVETAVVVSDRNGKIVNFPDDRNWPENELEKTIYHRLMIIKPRRQKKEEEDDRKIADNQSEEELISGRRQQQRTTDKKKNDGIVAIIRKIDSNDQTIMYYMPVATEIKQAGKLGLSLVGSAVKKVGEIGQLAIDVVRGVSRPVRIATGLLRPVPAVGEIADAAHDVVTTLLDEVQEALRRSSNRISYRLKEPWKRSPYRFRYRYGYFPAWYSDPYRRTYSRLQGPQLPYGSAPPPPGAYGQQGVYGQPATYQGNHRPGFWERSRMRREANRMNHYNSPPAAGVAQPAPPPPPNYTRP